MAVQVAAFAGVDESTAGLAGGMIETSREVGGAVGVAVVATIAMARVDDVLASAGAGPEATEPSPSPRGSSGRSWSPPASAPRTRAARRWRAAAGRADAALCAAVGSAMSRRRPPSPLHECGCSRRPRDHDRPSPQPSSTSTADASRSHRVALTGYAYRMLGSAFEAEDAVQETMVRAWRGFDRFEGRAAVAVVAVPHRHQRLPRHAATAAGGGRCRWTSRPVVGQATVDRPLARRPWVEPVPDAGAARDGDPAEAAGARESIRLAFVAALQHLPPRQRAVLILRDVLRWQATEVAELLDTTAASVNSALQRARATLADADLDERRRADARRRCRAAALLARYVEAFERYDIDRLVALLHEDATCRCRRARCGCAAPPTSTAGGDGEGAQCRGSRLGARGGQRRPGLCPVPAQRRRGDGCARRSRSRS